jgi:NitT/TauT family transport system ATP-binding protein
MSNPAIIIENMSVYYEKKPVLKEVSFKVNPGEFIAIVGRSGSGKTTILNAISGLIAYKGIIQCDVNLGYVFQNYALFPWMTVSQNIHFGLENMDVKSKSDRVKEIMQKTGISNFANRYPNQLSGGQIQRVALGRALAPDPELLLMDEPYAALDYHTREEMQKWLLNVWENSRKTVLFVTHSIEEALFLADRIIVITDGIFLIDEVLPFERPRNNDIRFTASFNETKQRVIQAMIMES